MSRGILQRLADPTLIALSVPESSWPRSLLGATLIPDAWMGLVERRDGRRRFVPAGDDPRLDDDASLLLVRNRLITVPLDVSGARARCENRVDVTCEMLLRWAARDDELAALKRSILFQAQPARVGRPAGGNGLAAPGLLELSQERLAQTVSEFGARTAVLRFVQERDAADLVATDLRAELLAVLRGEMARFLFEIGASIEQVVTLRFSSRTLAAAQAMQRDTEQRLRQIQSRQQIEAAAIQATQKRIDQLASVFEKLRGAASTADGLQWHELLPSLSPLERGQLLENLWRITPDRRKAASILVVAGEELIWLDPDNPQSILRRTALAADRLGLRSVAFDAPRGSLLVGAATCVLDVSAESGEVRRRYDVPPRALESAASAGPGPRTGFNAAAVVGEHLFATHSQLGCWSWPLSGGDGAACLLAPESGTPRTIRGVTAAGARVLFAADDCVQAYDPADGTLSVLAAADDTIHCLAALDDQLFVGTADGKLLRLDLRSPDDWWVPYRASAPIETIQPRRWNDLVELVVPAGASGVVGVYAEQNVVCRLLESPSPIRRAWASDDLIVALSHHRDRLVVLNSRSPQRGGRDVSLPRLVGNAAQDVCIVTADADAPG